MTQWRAFVRRTTLAAPALNEVIQHLRDFVMQATSYRS
jgi:hypothetical protein